MNNDGIVGYKAFYKGFKNKYGKVFEVGKCYKVRDEYKNTSYHFCKNLEDTLIYYREDDIVICEVIGYGDIIKYYNDYYGVYDVYASSEIKIVRVLSRKEIINMFLNMKDLDNRVIRFISLFKLNKEEIVLFKRIFKNNTMIMDAISYYQEGDVKVYERRYRNG